MWHDAKEGLKRIHTGRSATHVCASCHRRMIDKFGCTLGSKLMEHVQTRLKCNTDKKMLNLIRRMLSGPTPEEDASRELNEARKALLVAQTGEDYARSQVEYNRARIARLENYLRNLPS